VIHVHYDFADPAMEKPKSAEWRDSTGKLVYGAYYEYQFDSHENWTYRKVWIVSPDDPNRTLYETNSRTITYWGR
jgi:hypothetical protein